MAAEIDCINDKNEYVEIKTQKYIVPKTNNHKKHHYKRYNNCNEYPPPKIKYNNSNKFREIGGGYIANHNNDKKSEHEKIRYHPYNIQHKHEYNKYNNKEPIIPYYKSMKIWVQSYLGGVNNILIGFRDDKGMVVDIQTLSLNWFSNKINYFDKRRQMKVFKGNICINFTNNALDFIKLNCKIENVLYRIVFNHPWNKLVLFSRNLN